MSSSINAVFIKLHSSPNRLIRTMRRKFMATGYIPYHPTKPEGNTMIKTVIAVALGVATLSACGSTAVTAAPAPVVAAPLSILGNTDAAKYWAYQQHEDCIEQSARVVIDQVTGKTVSATAIDTYAATLKTPTGAPFYQPTVGSAGAYAAALYAHYGVTATVGSYGTDSQLEFALNAGDHVVALVNGQTLWTAAGYKLKAPVDFTSLNHAVVVDEINIVDQTVTLTDTGAPHGATETVSLAAFNLAWGVGSNSEILVTS